MRKFIFIFLLIASLSSYGQNPWKIEKSDWLPMGLTFGAGYSIGWREHALFHPKVFFEQYPNASHKFWDARMPSRWNSNHILKSTAMALMTAAIVVKIGDWKSYRKKKRWQKLAADALKYYGAYHLGFFISYNIQNQNKFTF